MKFVSQFESLRLIIDERREVIEDRETTLTPGLTVEFKEGKFETSDKALIKTLTSLPNYRKDFGPERITTKKEKAVAPKSRAPRIQAPKAPKTQVAKSPVKDVVLETNPNMTDTKTSEQTIVKDEKKSVKLNKEEVIN